MKKIFALILVLVVASMGCVSSFAMHVARDGVSAYDESTQSMGELITPPGGNNPDTTELGDISERQLDYIIVHGWYAFEVPIKEFGYKIGDDDPVLGSPKYYGADKDVIASQAEALNCAESVRFQIVVPVYAGKDVVITPVALDENDEVHLMPWKIVYTSTVGLEPGSDPEEPPTEDEPSDPPSDTPSEPSDTPSDTPEDKPAGQPGNAATADTTASVFMLAAFALAVTALIKKKAF